MFFHVQKKSQWISSTNFGTFERTSSEACEAWNPNNLAWEMLDDVTIVISRSLCTDAYSESRCRMLCPQVRRRKNCGKHGSSNGHKKRRSVSIIVAHPSLWLVKSKVVHVFCLDQTGLKILYMHRTSHIILRMHETKATQTSKLHLQRKKDATRCRRTWHICRLQRMSSQDMKHPRKMCHSTTRGHVYAAQHIHGHSHSHGAFDFWQPN